MYSSQIEGFSLHTYILGVQFHILEILLLQNQSSINLTELEKELGRNL
jgi:hypothetical protein